jgi:hypothetical protein
MSRNIVTSHCSLVLVTDQFSGEIVKRLSSVSDKNLNIHVALFKKLEELTPFDRKTIDSAKGRGIKVEIMSVQG